MQLPDFRLERYFARYEFNAPYLLSSSDCESLTVGEVLALEPGAAEAFQNLRLGYTEYEGDPKLRVQIAGLYENVEAKDVLVFSGAEEAIFVFMHAALQPGDHVIVHYPGYQSLHEIARSLGCDVTLWETRAADGWELDMDFLRRNLRPQTKTVIVNCPHNPTGYLMPHEKWRDLVALSREHGFRIFADEVYRLLEYDVADRLPAAGDAAENAVSLGVMSKAFGLPGLRIGWLVIRDRALYARLCAFKDYTTICNAAPSEFLATIGLRHKDALLARSLKIIRENRELLTPFFAVHSALFDWQIPKAGPIAFPALKSGDVETFCERAVTEAGVLLLPGTLYAPGLNHFRIGFGRANMPEALSLFDAYLHQSR